MSLLSDIEAMRTSPMPEVRATIAGKVAQYFNAGIFDEEEVDVAHDILRLLAKDAEMRVRKTLSEAIKANPKIPHDIAMTIAYDESDVAIPILEFSKVLTEGDLIEIVRSTQQVAKLKAIARRENISESVSSSLVHTRNPEVAETLFENVTALISEESYKIAVEEFQKNGSIINTLINRGGLPIGIAEKLINFASEQMREKLIQDYNIGGDIAKGVSDISRERATIKLLDDEPEHVNDELISIAPVKESKVESLVKHLHKEGRLTHSIVLRSLCEGNIAFFEASLAVLAGTSISNARTLISDKNPSALQALCKRAKLPDSIFKAMQVMLTFSIAEQKTGKISTPGFRQRLLEYIVTNDYDKSVPLMPYIIALISSKVQTHDLV